ncbi:MAG: PD-(D/E)XK nuclease family protein [Oscillospiraceae bacterium]|nr:PD-(D/E)XK nuclease family protein [Oscillospiraceae bacterium]
MLDLILGGAGCGKSYEMMGRIGDAAAAGQNVLVIIPDQFSAEFDKSLYERLGMDLFNRVNVLSFTRTAKDIFIKHGGIKGKYADDTVKNIMMFRTLKTLSERGDLCFFDKQAGSVPFIESCLNIVKELTVSGISPEELSACLAKLGDSVRDKASDISNIYSEYTGMLKKHGYKDNDSDISEAAAKANDCGYFKTKTVFIDAFKSFTADELRMIDAMIASAENVTVCLTTADRTKQKYSVFETVNNTMDKLKNLAVGHGVKVREDMLNTPHRFAAEGLAFYSKNVFGYSRDKYDGDDRPVSVYRSADLYGEGDFVCSEISRLVMDEGYGYSDIAVLARHKDRYSSVMESAFERYGIPFYTDESHTAAHKALFIFVKTALTLAADERASTEDWLRYMKTGLLQLSEEETGAAEEYCYKWGVDREMWYQPFDLDESGTAEDVRKRVTEPIAKLRKTCENADGHTVCQAIAALFDDMDICTTIENMYKYPGTEDAAALAAVREVKQLWELLCGLMETLDRALANVPVTLADFRDMFSAAVGRLKLSSPPQALDSVRFVAAHTARLDSVKAVFVIGANDGDFPYVKKQDGILSDRDRLALEEAGISLSGGAEDRLAEERFVAYSALSAASDRLYITYALSDVSGKAMYSSQVVNRAEYLFGEDITSDFEGRGLTFFCTSPEAAYYQYVQNYRRDDSDSASLRKVLEEIPEYAVRLDYLKRVAGSGSHGLMPGTGKKLFGDEIHFSASRFEDYNKCPFMYYCKKGLELYPIRKVDMDSPARGVAIHHCLCEILKGFNKDHFANMDRDAIRAEVQKQLDAYYKSGEVGGDYGKTRRYKAAFSRLTDTVTDVLVRLSEEFRQNDFVPDGFEYTLKKYGGDEAPLELTTQNGVKVWFDGMIDRVDVFVKDGKSYVRVVDYKSGTKEFRFSDLVYGVNMQMLLYLFALTDHDRKGKYTDSIPAGVLYMPSKDAASYIDRDGVQDSKKKDNYKMSGAVLEDEDIITAMERDCGGKFIPVKRDKNGNYTSSNLLNEKQFDNLRKYSYTLLEETAGKLHEGKIEAGPLKEDKRLSCEYCDYKTVCGNYPPGRQTIRQYNAKDSGAQIKEIMNEENVSGSGNDNGEADENE